MNKRVFKYLFLLSFLLLVADIFASNKIIFKSVKNINLSDYNPLNLIKHTKAYKKNISTILGGGAILQNVSARSTGYSGQVRIVFDTVVNAASPISKIVVSNDLNSNKDSIGTGAAISFIDGYINGILINNLTDGTNTSFTLTAYLLNGTTNTFTVTATPTVGKINSFRTTSFQMNTSTNFLSRIGQYSDNIYLPRFISLNSNYTIETWFNVVDKTLGWQRIFEGTDVDRDTNSISIGFWGTSGNLFIKVPGAGNIELPNVNISNNTWYHICLVKNGSTAKFYVNGTEVLSTTGVTNYKELFLYSFLGKSAYRDANNYAFVGKLQDFRIWNVARDSANIQENMTKDLAGFGNTPDLNNYKGLFYWLRLDNNGARKTYTQNIADRTILTPDYISPNTDFGSTTTVNSVNGTGAKWKYDSTKRILGNANVFSSNMVVELDTNSVANTQRNVYNLATTKLGQNGLNFSAVMPLNFNYGNVWGRTKNTTNSAIVNFLNNFTTNVINPDTPIITSVTSGNGQATVFFTAPINTGGQSILNYKILAKPVSGGSFISSVVSGSPGVITGLTNGVKYRIQIITNTTGTYSLSSDTTVATNILVTPFVQGINSYHATSFKTTTVGVSIGSTDYIRLPPLDMSGSYTIETWFKGNGTLSSWKRVFDFGSGPNLNGVLLGFASATEIGYLSNGSEIRITRPSNFIDNDWNHLALSFDGTNISFYVNGVLADKRTGQNAILAGTCTSNFIGRSNWDNDSVTQGQWEDFRIWKEARDSNQIRQYMSAYPTSNGTLNGTAIANLYFWLPLNLNDTSTKTRSIIYPYNSFINASNLFGPFQYYSYVQNNNGAKFYYDSSTKIIRGSFGSPLNANEAIQVSTDSTFTTNVGTATYNSTSNNFTVSLPNGSSFTNGTIYGRVRNTATNTTLVSLNNLQVILPADTPKITNLDYGQGSNGTNNLSITYTISSKGSTITSYNATLVPESGSTLINASTTNANPFVITGLNNALNYTLKLVAQTNLGKTDTVYKKINQIINKGITQVCENQVNVAFSFSALTTPTQYTIRASDNINSSITNNVFSSPGSLTGLNTANDYMIRVQTNFTYQGVAYTVTATDSTKRLIALAPNINDTGLCIGKTIASLPQTYNGNVVKWYAAKTGGASLATSTVINTTLTLYASQIIGGCETVSRDSVLVTIFPLPSAPPTVVDQRFNPGSIISNIVYTTGAGGNGANFYLNSLGGTLLAGTTPLIEQTYYATSVSLQGCESATRTTFSIFLNTLPGVPTNVLDTATGVSGQVRVRFSAPSNNGGTTITKYVITSTGGIKDSVCSTCPKTDITDVLNNGILINGLTNNSPYSFTVVAQNGAGYSASSASSALAVPVAEGINSYRAVSFKTSTKAITANSDNIKLPSIDLSNRDYTIETWFKYNESTVGSFNRIFDFNLTNTVSTTSVLLCLRQATLVNNPTLFFFAGNFQQGDIATNININNWNHFALTLSNTTAKLYINGVLVQTSSGARATGVFMSNFIGASNDGAISTAGQWEDFRIWRVARDSNQIREYITKYPTSDGTLTGTANLTGLYLWLPLNQGQKIIRSQNIKNKTILTNASVAGGAHAFNDTITSIADTGARWNVETARVLGTNVKLLTGQVVQVNADNNFPTGTNNIGAVFSTTFGDTNSYSSGVGTFKNGTIYSRVAKSSDNSLVRGNYALTVSTVPDTVVIGTLISGNNSITINYTPNSNNGGLAYTSNSYKIIPINISTGVYGTATTISNSTSGLISTTITGLTNGIGYRFKIVAINNNGSSDTATTASIIPIGGIVIDSIVNICENGLKVAFKPPVGFVLQGNYTVGIYNQLGTNLINSITTTTSPVTFSGLTKNTTYLIRISGSNAVGVTINSTDSIKTTFGLPAPVIPDTALCSGASYTLLRQTYNGNAILWYTTSSGNTLISIINSGVLSSSISLFAQQTINGCVSSARDSVYITINPLPLAPSLPTPQTVYIQPSTTFNVANLVTINSKNNNNIYNFYISNVLTNTINITTSTTINYRVSQVDINLCESPKTSADVTVNYGLSTVSGVPTSLLAVSTGYNGKVSLSFSAPISDGNSPITNYVLYNGATQIITVTNPGTYTIAGLTNHLPYTFSIRAFNLNGQSALGTFNTVIPVSDTINSYRPYSFQTNTSSLLNNGDHIQLPIFSLGSVYSVETWFKASTTAPPNWARIFDFGNGLNNSNLILGFPLFGTTTFLGYRSSNTQGPSSYSAIPGNVDITKWNHYALVFDGTNLKLYINGVYVPVLLAQNNNGPVTLGGISTSHGGIALTAVTNLNTNYIGRSNYGGDASVIGQWEDFRVWNIVLDTVTGIKSNMSKYPTIDGKISSSPLSNLYYWLPLNIRNYRTYTRSITSDTVLKNYAINSANTSNSIVRGPTPKWFYDNNNRRILGTNVLGNTVQMSTDNSNFFAAINYSTQNGDGYNFYYNLPVANTFKNGVLYGKNVNTNKAFNYSVITVPDTPNFNTFLLGNGKVTLNLIAPINNGGQAITGYNYNVYNASTNALVASGSTSTLSTEIGGLTNGVSYRFKVVALNGLQDYINATLVNLASDTATSASVTPIGSIIINSITQKCDTAIINFSPPPGYSLTNYTVTAIISNGATITSSGNTTISIGGNLSLKLLGLGSGVLDTFRISGYSGAGNTNLVFSADSIKVFSTQSPLSAPTISKQTITTLNSTKIVISNLISTQGSNNVNYYTTNSYSTPASDASFAIRIYASNTTYPYFASLSNTSGCLSPISSVVIVDSNIQVPGVPTGVTVNSTGISGQVNISFTTGVANNGIISQYTVTASDGVNMVITASGLSSPILINGLVNNRSYNFTVTATNIAGLSASSTAVKETPIDEGAKSYRAVSFQTNTNTSIASITNFVPNYDYINLPTLQLDSIYTVETWFKLTNASNSNFPSIYNFGGWNNGLILFTGSGQNSLNVKSWGAEANGGVAPASGPLTGVTLRNGIWYHIAVVVRGINTRVYVNGNLVANYPNLNALGVTNNNTYTNNGIGLAPANGSMVGQWEDFRIWKLARDSNQIKEYMTKYPTTDGTLAGTANLSGLYLWLPLNQGQKYISTRNIDNKTLLVNASTATGAHSIVDTIYSISNLGAKWNYETNNKRVLGSFVTLANGQNVQYSLDSTNWTNATYQIPITNSFIDSIAPPSNYVNGKIYNRIFNGVSVNRILNTINVTTVPTSPTISIPTGDTSKASIQFSLYTSNINSVNSGNISAPPTINRYVVKASPGNITASSSTSPVTITGLTSGVTYTIKGITSNDGVYYSDSSFGATVTLISKPRIDSVIACDTVATIYFKAPLILGTATIASYTVGIRNTSTNVFTQITNIPNTSTSFTITGLTNAQAYNFIITAISSQNSGATVVSSTDSLSNINIAAIPAPNVASTSNVCLGSLDSTLQNSVNPAVNGFGAAAGFNWYNSTSSTSILNKSVGTISASNYYFSQLINLPKKYTSSGNTLGVCEGFKRAVVNINIITGASFSTNVSTSKTGNYCSTDNTDSLKVVVIGSNPTYQWNRVRYNTAGTTAQDTLTLPVLSYTSAQSNTLRLPTFNVSNIYKSKADSGTFKYYVVVNTTCGTLISNLSGNINIFLNPSFTTQPSTTLQTYCANASAGITALSVIGSPTGANLTYRWYYDSSTTDAVNNFVNSKILIGGATAVSYTPQSNVSGYRKYYAEITNSGLASCRATSNASGTITINQPIAAPTVGVTSYNNLINDTLKYLDTNVKIATGNTNIKWYSNALGTIPITNIQTTPLTANGVYYATQTVNVNGINCESNTLPITTSINYPARKLAAPTLVSVGNGQAIINIVKNTTKNSGRQFDSATQFQIITNPASTTTTVLANSFEQSTDVTIPSLANKQAYTVTVKAINTATKGDSISGASVSFSPNYDSIINYKSTSFKATGVSSFNNINGDYITLPTPLILDNNYTLETWFKLANYSTLNYTRIFNLGSDYLFLLLYDNTRKLGMYVNGLPVTNAFNPSNLPTLNPDTWYHISMVVSNNGTLVTLYINGLAVFSGPTSGTASNSFTATNFLGRTTGVQSTTAGQYEDFRIWKKAKTALEVYQQYNTKLTGAETGLYYWLPLGNSQHERFNSYNILDNATIPNAATSLQSIGNSNSTVTSQANTGASWYYDNSATPIDRRVYLTHRSYINGEFTEISIDGGFNWNRSSNLPATIGTLSALNTNDDVLVLKQTLKNGVIKARIRNSAGTATIANFTDYVIQTVPDTVRVNSIIGLGGAATINFTKPVDTGLSTITGYQVINNGSTSINANGQTGIAPGTLIPGLLIPGNSTNVTITGLTNSTTYRFALTAVNAKGVSDTTRGWNVTPLDTALNPTITICDTIGVISFNALAGINYTIVDSNTSTNARNVITGTTSATNKIIRTGLLNGNTYRFYISLSTLDGSTVRTNTGITKVINKIVVNVAPLTSYYCQANSPIGFNNINTTGGNGLYTYRWYSNTSNSFVGATLKPNVQINTDTPYIKTVADNSPRYYFVSVGDSINGSTLCTNLITNVGILVSTVTVYTNPTITNVSTIPTIYCKNQGNLPNTIGVTTGGGSVISTIWYRSFDSTYTNRQRVDNTGAVSNTFVVNGLVSTTLTPKYDSSSKIYYFAISTQANTTCNVTTNISGSVTVLAKMGIVTQPTGTTNYCTSLTTKNNYSNLIIVDSSENGIGTIKRQWYKTNRAGLISSISSKDTLIIGANTLNYNPGTGANQAIDDTTNYYFVLLTYNGVSGLSCDSVISSVATVNVYTPPTINVITSPTNTFATTNYCINAVSVTSFQTNAVLNKNVGTIAYQWKSNTSNSNVGGVNIIGATNNTYTPLTNNTGTTYYYLEATNTIPNCTSSSIQTGAINVLNTPDVTYNFGNNDTSYCTNSNIKPLTITYTGIGISTVTKWYYVGSFNGTKGVGGH